ncbi:MAG: DEAD/DEAH box helicase [Patescibacteria group bacterium]
MRRRQGGGRPGGHVSGGSGRPQGGHTGGRGRSGGGGQGRTRNHQNSGAKIDISRFINKATAVEEVKYEAKHKFEDFPLNAILKTNIANKGYKSPTPIQDQAIPPIIKGQDVVGIAQTGTGKTAAFLIPLINKVLFNPREKVLILAPVRELASQIRDEFMGFSKGMHLYSALCVGGMGIVPQMRDMKRNPNFVIATPGRLRDLIKRRAINLEQFQNIVLDEADRMVDMGFIHEVKYILSLMSKKRHSLFFSATVSPAVHGLIQQFLTNPVTVSVKVRETSSNVDQEIIKITDKAKKMDILQDLLRKPDFNKVLIFGRTKHGVEKISDTLRKAGFHAASIHGNKTQNNRQKALDMFKKGELNVLVATDVAARGLDISDVSHVINYDVPATYEDYVHRIGRTGRANKAGSAVTFVE